MLANFEYYKIFYYVAKYQNFTQAANVLLSSQPSVTRCMQNLEHELGCRLFIRSKRGVSLTPEGELLYAHVAPACEYLLKGEEALSGALGLQGGSVYIGATETALHSFLLDRLNLFHQKYPGVRLKITNNSTPQAIADLRTGKIDLAVVTTPVETKKPLKKVGVQAFRDILVSSYSFPALKEGVYSLKELNDYPLICLADTTMTYDFYKNFYASHGLLLKPDIELATADLILPMIRQGLGIGFVPEDLVRDALESGEIFEIRLEEEIPERQICIICDTERPLSVAARQLEQILIAR